MLKSLTLNYHGKTKVENLCRLEVLKHGKLKKVLQNLLKNGRKDILNKLFQFHMILHLREF
jgi:hypothetical protein